MWSSNNQTLRPKPLNVTNIKWAFVWRATKRKTYSIPSWELIELKKPTKVSKKPPLCTYMWTHCCRNDSNIVGSPRLASLEFEQRSKKDRNYNRAEDSVYETSDFVVVVKFGSATCRLFNFMEVCLCRTEWMLVFVHAMHSHASVVAMMERLLYQTDLSCCIAPGYSQQRHRWLLYYDTVCAYLYLTMLDLALIGIDIWSAATLTLTKCHTGKLG